MIDAVLEDPDSLRYTITVDKERKVIIGQKAGNPYKHVRTTEDVIDYWDVTALVNELLKELL